MVELSILAQRHVIAPLRSPGATVLVRYPTASAALSWYTRFIQPGLKFPIVYYNNICRLNFIQNIALEWSHDYNCIPIFLGDQDYGWCPGLEDGCITPLTSMSGCRCFASSRLCRAIRQTHCRIGGLFPVSTQCFTKLVRPGLSLSANRSVLAKNNRKNCCFCSCQLLTTILYPSSRAFLIWLLKSQRSLPCLLL